MRLDEPCWAVVSSRETKEYDPGDIIDLDDERDMSLTPTGKQHLADGEISIIRVVVSPVSARCFDCGLDYEDPGWLEAVVSNSDWEKISPTNDENGLLCSRCMARRMVALGMSDVRASIYCGPMIVVESVPKSFGSGFEPEEGHGCQQGS